MSPEATSADLESVPGIGPKIASDLRSLAIFTVGDLKGKDPEKMYRSLEARAGMHLDRCLLYVFRCAVYYASNDEHDPEKLKWWRWKDERPEKSP